MEPRAAVYDLISSDPQLIDLGVRETYAANSVDTPEEDLFIIISWQTSDARVWADKASRRCMVWVHDTHRDYGRINAVLARVTHILATALHVLGDDGVTLTCAQWNFDGPETADEGYNTVTRWADFTVLGR